MIVIRNNEIKACLVSSRRYASIAPYFRFV